MPSNMRRPRRGPEPGEFEDQLSNYDAPEYSDDLERAMCEDQVDVIRGTPFLRVTPNDTINDVLKLMDENHTACAVVVEDDKPIGIFSEKDVLFRLANHYHKYANLPVSEVMTPDPVVVYETDTPARVMNVMRTGDFRHVPIVDVDGKIVGLIGTSRLTAYIQQFFSIPS